MPEYIYRDATANDTGALTKLAIDLTATYGYQVTAGEWSENLRNHLANYPDNYRMLVAEYAGDIVAMGAGAFYQLTPSVWLKNGRMGYLQWFYTVPEHRKQGIASHITKEIMAWMRSHAVTRIRLDSEKNAQEFWVGFDFEPNRGFFDLWWAEPGTLLDGQTHSGAPEEQ